MHHDDRQPKSHIKVALIQTYLYWQQPEANRAHFEELIWQIQPGSVDLILLPEMFNTGFAVEATHLAEPLNLFTHRWMQQMAAQVQAVVAGSIMLLHPVIESVTNTFLWVTPDGTTHTYDKRHLFSFAGEHKYMSKGIELPIFYLHGWRFCPQICYDLRFPAFVRNIDLKYDVLCYVANWPNGRIQAWDILLPARAVENSCYVLGVNRIGQDGKGLVYSGHTGAYDFKGNTLAKAHPDTSEILTLSLEYQALQQYREKFPVHLDADHFKLED